MAVPTESALVGGPRPVPPLRPGWSLPGFGKGKISSYPQVKSHTEGGCPGTQSSTGPLTLEGISLKKREWEEEDEEEDERELSFNCRYQWIWSPYRHVLRDKDGDLPTYYSEHSAFLFPRFPILVLFFFLLFTIYVYVNHEFANSVNGYLEESYKRLSAFNLCFIALCCIIFL